MEYIIIAIIAYLIGSINFSILISKKKAGMILDKKAVVMLELLIC